MSTPKNAADSIEPWMLLMIRACKKNKNSFRTLRRIYGVSRALSLEHTPIEYVTNGLMEIIVKYNLVRDWHQFIIDVDHKRTGFWFVMCKDPEQYTMPFNQAYLRQCISVIALTNISVFPYYPRPAWFRNQYGKVEA